MSTFDSPHLTLRLQQGLDALEMTLSAAQVDLCIQYLQLLDKWNKVYNLTAISDSKKMVAYHLLDSLVVARAIPDRASCLDVGTGAGLPGIPLAIANPMSSWLLIDSNGKKTRFVQQVIAELGLTNVNVVQTRIQDYDAASSLDVIVSRAYASLAEFVDSVSHLWQSNSRLITMKTQLSDTEIQGLDIRHYRLQITPIQVPGITEPRSLVSIERKQS